MIQELVGSLSIMARDSSNWEKSCRVMMNLGTRPPSKVSAFYAGGRGAIVDFIHPGKSRTSKAPLSNWLCISGHSVSLSHDGSVLAVGALKTGINPVASAFIFKRGKVLNIYRQVGKKLVGAGWEPGKGKYSCSIAFFFPTKYKNEAPIL